MIVVPVRFPEDLYNKLKELASLYGDSFASLVRKASEKEVKKLTKVKRKKQIYVNPLLEMAHQAEKRVSSPDQYPDKTDDELLYGEEI